ncbi:hypothetical protein C7S18_15920 [Ahniella affigens]|uniref:FHA domain-containing protein n=1 Tax=Ahniella affigens TaxID=2021234 RepID=A0A2P1PUR3_9GAMM|nr:FHA domain-containing protein [Ahniella affigens]AVP98583.1 hypothetical protein C7S18_15920 [Ahniella affigens]
MLRIRIRFLSGSKEGTVEVFPTARYDCLYFGRDASCDVRFHPDQDPMVSRNHAVLEWRPQDGPQPVRVLLSDLLSSNGTFLNDRPVREATVVFSGDLVRFGRGGPLVRIELERAEPRDGEERPAVRQTQEMPRAEVADTQRRKIPNEP